MRNKLASGFFEILLPSDYADVNELRYILHQVFALHIILMTLSL